MSDTIFARATARGRAAIAIVRISGPESAHALISLAGDLPKPRHAAVRHLRDVQGELIDESLILWMPGPHSFTGEDTAELHLHGGEAVVDAVSEELSREGLRQADPGEFSRRAFTNGRMDLLQAEAVADLVDAQTAAQRRQALAQMAGGVGRRFEEWRGELIEALALLEAENDFPDEDLPGSLAAQAVARLAPLVRDLEQARATSTRGRGVREGYRVAIIGQPNVGKSSLFNRLLGRPAAIVSETPGTTRDVVEATTLIGGHLVTFADTAGIRATADEVEAEGVRRAHAWATGAAVRLLVVEGDSAPAEEHLAILEAGDLLIRNKSDLLLPRRAEPDIGGLHTLQSSTVTQQGLQDVRLWLNDRVSADLDSAEPPFSTRARHEEAIAEALQAISRAQTVAESFPERAVEDLRRANSALRSIVGDVNRDAVLDRVFASFCIGK